MKQLLIILFLMSASAAGAQTWSEWFRQKKTQIKYLVEQNAALLVYTGYLKDGYSIARKGLNTIGSIRDGEWSLHKDFFGSLSIVNPRIKGWARVGEIIALQANILKRVKTFMQDCKVAGQLNESEMEYVQRVCDNALKKSLQNLDELIIVLTSGELQMTDDERIKRVEGIFCEMQEGLVFIELFGGSVIQLLRGRLHEKVEVQLSKTLNMKS